MKPIGQLKLVPDTLAVDVAGSDDRPSRLMKLIGGDTAAYASLSVGDLLYDSFRIDPLAVQGIDFARAADLSDIFRLARFAESLAELAGPTRSGSIAQLNGYVAERIAAQALLAEGADVSFPATSNQAGWDLLVNGERFQVKCLASPAGIRDHFARYPDIPVIANIELAQACAGDERVTTLGAFSHADVEATTRDTLDAAADLLDLQIPLIAAAVGSARAAIAVLRKDADPLAALGGAAIGVAAGAGGGAGGAMAAAVALGLVGITGGWIAVIAPVFGGIAGYRGGSFIANHLKQSLLARSEASLLRRATQDFAGEAARVLAAMASSSESFRAKVVAMPEHDGAFAGALKSDWLRRVDREIERRRWYERRLAAAAEDPRTIEPSAHDPRAHAMRAMCTAGQGGVLPANLRSATQTLRAAASAYDRALKRWLCR